MALATLFQDIGVNDAAEARAVIHKILNKKTSDLTPQQQGMLGTGIYRDISDELDILDAAGNPITRTSTVTLPSGEKMESKFTVLSLALSLRSMMDISLELITLNTSTML